MEQEYRGYRLLTDNFCMIRIVQLGKGMSPMDLRGNFTTQSFAKQAIDAYLDKKGAKDGKPVRSGTD